MSKKSKSIPVNPAAGEFATGIAIIGKISANGLNDFEEFEESHRDNFHLFLLQEKGTTSIEIDFQKYTIQPSSIAYIHPSQIHRLISFDKVTFTSWAIDNENLNPEYLKLLEDIAPVAPLLINEDSFSIISETVSLCTKLSERNEEKLFRPILKDSCNILVALVISQYLEKSNSAAGFSRFETVTKAFKSLLERDFITTKKPTEYAQALNISTPYLNECVKNTTGYSVSYHIQQRIVLEAKRLLYHSNQSVKEISADLGFDDYPYFSRLFTKVTGMSPLSFRKKNLE
jgi:AraC-like DNA-binding protein